MPKPLSLAPLTLAAASLAAGFTSTGRWSIVILALLWFLAGWFFRRSSNPWVPLLLLITAVCQAGFGVLSGAPSFLMILSAAAALAYWDLALSEQALAGTNPQPGSRPWGSHRRSLASALVLGLLAATLGLVSHLKMPFGVMVLLISAVFLGLDWLARSFQRRDPGARQ